MHWEETTEFNDEVTLARLLETDEAALAAAPNEVCVEALARADEAAEEADAATEAAEDWIEAALDEADWATAAW